MTFKKKMRRSVRRRLGIKRRGGSGRRNVPLAPLLGLAGGLAIPALDSWNMTNGQSPTQRVKVMIDQVGQGIYGYSSINQQWYTGNMTRFWAPVAGGAIAHIVAGKLGINRALSRARLGFTI